LEEVYKSGKKEMSTTDITRVIGANLGEGSFLYWAYKNNIPGIMDGGEAVRSGFLLRNM